MRFFTNMKAAFGTDDYTFLGYPSGQQNPVRLNLEQTYVIASTAEDPQLVWELIEAFFITDTDALYKIHSIPVLKSMFEAIADDYAQYDFITFFSGSGGQVLHDDKTPFTEEDLEQPGIITRFTEQDRQRILNLFDNVNQPSLTERMPEDVRQIIDEEVSAFLNGNTAAERCAEIVQSRVSIWLAEHK